MKSNINACGFDTLLQPTDWRFSAAVVGLVKYLDFHNLPYKKLYDCDESELPEEYIKGFDGVLYNQIDLTEERYLDFAESYFKKDMTHIQLINLFQEDKLEKEEIKTVNKLLKDKSISHFVGEISFDSSNSELIVSSIINNRYKIINYKLMVTSNLYRNYFSVSKNDIKLKRFDYLTEKKGEKSSRLNGYHIDKDKKSNNQGFCFNKNAIIISDVLEFDFIPFAFSNSDMFETYFINNNYSVDTLVDTSEWLSKELDKIDKNDSREKLLTVLKDCKKYIDYDVEIITKSRENDMYESLFVRVDRLVALQELSDKSISFAKKLAEGYWLNLKKEVYDRCLNNLVLDDLILLMLKLYFDDGVNKTTAKFRTESLIDINQLWKGNVTVNDIQSIKNLGFVVSQELVRVSGKNKVFSYKQKLISALVAHDYDRVKEVLLSLSAYVKMEFPFFYTFLENAEENKDLVFAFANALHINENN